MSEQKYVVVENGKRVTANLSEEQARQEAARRAKLNESNGQNASKVEVKQSLCG